MDNMLSGSHVPERALLDGVLDVLGRERPGIAVAPYRLIDMGFSSYVLLTGAGFIVRVARTAEAGASHSRECQLLPEISRLVQVAVPAPVWRLPAGPESRYGAMAYPQIIGDPLAREGRRSPHLVAQLATFLAQLHQARDDTVAAVINPLAAWKGATISVTEVAVHQLADELAAREHARLREWCGRFVAMVSGIADDRQTVVHGDFWHANILIRGGRLAGVLDWESAALADPAVDLAPVWDISVDLGAELLRQYQARTPPDPSLPERIRMFRIARNLGGITWSINNNDSEEYADSLRKVEAVLLLI
jgi:aminoglycoside phosphotransferase (APT) family kinase protein